MQAIGRIELPLLDGGRSSTPSDLRPSLATTLYHKKCQMFLSTTKGRAPKEPDPRLTSRYLRTDRRTVVTRLLVSSALKTSSVSVVNSVPRYFIGFRTGRPSASGARPFGTAAS